MNDAPTTVLLVEGDPADAGVIQAALAGWGGGSTGGHTFRVEWVTRLFDALERLGREVIEVVPLDLTLPDGQGIEAFDQVFQAAPDALIVVLSAARNEETARHAVQRTARPSRMALLTMPLRRRRASVRQRTRAVAAPRAWPYVRRRTDCARSCD